MQTKWIAAGAVALLVAGGAVGVTVGAGLGSAPQQEPTEVAAATTNRPSSPARERPGPGRRREEPAAPVAESAPPPVVAPAAAPAAPGAAGAAAAAPAGDSSKPTPAVLDAAKSLGVSEDAVRAAWAAYDVLRHQPIASSATPEAITDYRRRRADALAVLSACGDAAFPAVVALIKGGEQGTYFQELILATVPNGRERMLVELAEDRNGPKWTDITALMCLGTTDTQEVRDYLVARLQREREAYWFVTTAQSLGRLHDARGLPLCRDRLRAGGAAQGTEWTAQLRGMLVGAIVDMDKDEGSRALVECLRDPAFDLASTAVAVLGTRVDASLAKTEAAALVASGRVDRMAQADADIVRKWADAR